MVQVERIRRVYTVVEGAQLNNRQAIVDLNVSTVAELPEMNAIADGIRVLPNSIANITQTGEWYKLDDDGKWYNQDGSGEA